MNVLNGACVILAITSCAAGCATPAPATEPVRVTITPADVASCNLLGKVIVSDTAPDPAKEARAQTAGLGGNVIKAGTCETAFLEASQRGSEDLCRPGLLPPPPP